MYSSCLFCHQALGTNDVIEPFPVGRRLAFDQSRGRLWVVCVACGRWNLTPAEERWEAIEECERRFRATVLRASTDNVGLAHLREGLELVRIGRPLRPEFAAWRYTEQFLRRHRRSVRNEVGESLSGLGIAAAVGVGTLFLGVFAYSAARWAEGRLEARRLERPLAYLVDDAGRRVLVRARHIEHVDFVPDGSGDGWALRLDHDDGSAYFGGQRGVRTLGGLLARINAAGASELRVQQAVDAIERAGDPDAYLALIARVGLAHPMSDGSAPVPRLSIGTRLALEMAAHEDAERRALEGELSELERAWSEAEEIAAIADAL